MLSRTINFKQHEIIIEANSDLSDNESGFTLWDASLTLAMYFENTTDFPENYWKGKKVIELGCGCGLLGIIASLEGAEEVVLSDQEFVLHQTQKKY